MGASSPTTLPDRDALIRDSESDLASAVGLCMRAMPMLERSIEKAQRADTANGHAQVMLDDLRETLSKFREGPV